jgi:hypothetical protein
VTGKVPLQGVAREQAEVQEWEDRVEEEWAVPEPVQGLVVIASARNVVPLYPTKLECRAMREVAPNVGLGW